jgi:hypothetical protein
MNGDVRDKTTGNEVPTTRINIHHGNSTHRSVRSRRFHRCRPGLHVHLINQRQISFTNHEEEIQSRAFAKTVSYRMDFGVSNEFG